MALTETCETKTAHTVTGKELTWLVPRVHLLVDSLAEAVLIVGINAHVIGSRGFWCERKTQVRLLVCDNK